MLKSAYDTIKKNDLQQDFPDVYHKCKEKYGLSFLISFLFQENFVLLGSWFLSTLLFLWLKMHLSKIKCKKI